MTGGDHVRMLPLLRRLQDAGRAQVPLPDSSGMAPQGAGRCEVTLTATDCGTLRYAADALDELGDEHDKACATRLRDLEARLLAAPEPVRSEWERSVLTELMTTISEATANEIPDFLLACSTAMIRARKTQHTDT